MSVLRISQRTTANKKLAGPLVIPPVNLLGTEKFSLVSGTVESYSSNTGHRVAFFTTSSSILVAENSNVEYIIVAGGGGGGGWSGGGGGAGGMIQGNITLFASNTYSFVLGAGGSGTTSSTYPDSGKTKGGNTTAFGFIARGGGQGGQFSLWTQEMVDGGSGGGSAFPGNAQGAGFGFPSPVQQGHPGSSYYGNYYGGGGGGAGQAGNNLNGGNGRIISWLEPSTYTGNARNIGQVWAGQTYLAGGGSSGGFSGQTTGNAGLGGGGRGAGFPGIAGRAGNVNTGGGGGAAVTNSPTGTDQNGATTGGSGVIILRYIP